MVKVKDLDISLSLKLGDTVGSSNDDGAIFKQADRVRYLTRGYARLVRMLNRLMRKEAPLFAQNKLFHEQSITSSSVELKIGDTPIVIEKLDEVYTSIKKNNTEIYSGLATYIEPNGYIAVKEGVNEHYTPIIDGANSKIYYTILDNKISLLPILSSESDEGVYDTISAVFRSDVITFDINDSLAIPNEYIDLLISLAAMEGMQDIARSDKVSLYSADINNQLSILKGYADLIESKKGSDTNG